MKNQVIRCINTASAEQLTLRKDYASVNEASGQYLIYNDAGTQCWYNKSLFKVMPLPRQHHEEIIAWANGAIIEWRYPIGRTTGTWLDCCDNKPCWSPENEYRVKPINHARIRELENKLANALDNVRTMRAELKQLQ